MRFFRTWGNCIGSARLLWETIGQGLAAAPAQVGETVLAIDDEPVVRMLVVDVLEELGRGLFRAAIGQLGQTWPVISC